MLSTKVCGGRVSGYRPDTSGRFFQWREIRHEGNLTIISGFLTEVSLFFLLLISNPKLYLFFIFCLNLCELHAGFHSNQAGALLWLGDKSIVRNELEFTVQDDGVFMKIYFITYYVSAKSGANAVHV